MTIRELTDAVERYMRSKRYTDLTVMSYRYTWNQLCLFATREGVEEYTFEYGLKFAKENYGIDYAKLEPPFSERQGQVYRALRRLDEYQRGVPMSTCKRPLKEPLPEAFREIIENYMACYAKRNLSRSTLRHAEYTLRKFTEFLCELKITQLGDISAGHVCGFAETLGDYVSTTRNTWLSRIKDFLNYAHEIGVTEQNTSVFVPKARYLPAPKLPSTYSKEEVGKILSAVDRANPVGKRDYAILKLASCLGMRSGDIAQLKLESIDWQKDTIRYEQEKGGKPHTLPLLNDIGESLIDYLKNGRPQIKSPFVFLKHSAPYTALTAAALHPIMKKYRTMAKIPAEPPRKAGLHALRHSLATSLLEDSTPLPTISEVLNHKNTATTRIYTRIDIVSLKKCALEVPVVIGGEHK